MPDVNPANPLAAPYRTGAYLISDVGPDNFRSAATLTDSPYRASGSHQLGISDFVRVLQPVIETGVKHLYLVDLREETHGFFDGSPVSWYADNDFGNVGQTREWIEEHEKMMLDLHKSRQAQLFVIEDDATDDLQQERVLPTSYTEIWPAVVHTESGVAKILSDVFAPSYVSYKRIHVTDHCAPSERALTDLQNLASNVGENDWVHFHCHGGDGRTSTFLALYDMLCWKKTGNPLPALEEFSDRQCQLFSYCLDPAGSETCGKPPKPWQLPLAQARWAALGAFLTRLNGSSGVSPTGQR